MSNVPTLVCPVDFSDHSRVALAEAAAWARHRSARLIVVTVVEPLLVNAAAATYDTDLVRHEVLPELRDFIEKTLATAAAGRTSPEAVVLVGDTATEIVALAGRERAHLIVIATHGLSGYRKLLLGSTTEQVLRHTTVPVLVTPPNEQTTLTTDSPSINVARVLAPVDFKPECVADVRAAAALARTFGVPLLLLHVVAPLKGLERLRSQLDRHNSVRMEQAGEQIRQLVSELSMPADVETLVAAGSPAEEIARIAVARGVGLILMGLRRQEHMFGTPPGSVAYRVLGLAPVRVLALPPGEWTAHLPSAL